MRHAAYTTLTLVTIAAAAGCGDTVAPDPEPAQPAPLAAGIAAGNEYACALLASGTVLCTGELVSSSGMPAGLVSIRGGEQHACGLHVTGALRCWGVNTHGRLLVPGGLDFIDVAPGSLHTCALRGEGEIACWGNSPAGLAQPPKGIGYRAIAAARGGEYTCALAAGGSIACWGQGVFPPPAGQGWSDIELASNGGCVLDAERSLECWGAPEFEALEGRPVTAFSAGRDFLCAISAGRIHCAGPGGSAVLAPPDGDDFIQIGAGYRHACALRGDGTVACWGSMTLFPGVAQ